MPLLLSSFLFIVGQKTYFCMDHQLLMKLKKHRFPYGNFTLTS